MRYALNLKPNLNRQGVRRLFLRLALRLALHCGVACAALAPASAVLAKQVTVSLDQAHRIGLAALNRGNYKLAHSVAEQLLQARPDDVTGLILLAASAPHIGKAKEGRLAGRKAFLSAKKPIQKLNAATYAAVASAKEDRPLLTQLWLRRAYQQTQTEEQRDAIAKQYRKYSRTSPVRLSFAASISPSSNLNGGSDAQYLIIDGVYPIGVLSGSAQALSGTRASASAKLTYTLSERPAHKTTLTFAGSVSRVRLSSEAQALAPTTSNSDLGDTQVSARLVHQIAHNGRPIPDTYTLAIGQTWFGGEEYYTFGTVGLSRKLRLGKATQLRLGARYTFQNFANSQTDKGTTTLQFGLVHRLANRDSLHLNLSLGDTTSKRNNSTYQSFSANLGYQLGKPIGPATLAASIGYGETKYSDYRIGFVQVPGGREDKTTHAKLNITFKDISYMGFVPQLNINHVRTKSNISRFERKTTGLGLSFISAF